MRIIFKHIENLSEIEKTCEQDGLVDVILTVSVLDLPVVKVSM